MPLTLWGNSVVNRSLVRTKDRVLRPGEDVSFFHPMLGWQYDLSVPARYRIEVTWSKLLQAYLPPVEPPVLTAEFLSNPDPDMRSKPEGLVGAKESMSQDPKK